MPKVAGFRIAEALLIGMPAAVLNFTVRGKGVLRMDPNAFPGETYVGFL